MLSENISDRGYQRHYAGITARSGFLLGGEKKKKAFVLAPILVQSPSRQARYNENTFVPFGQGVFIEPWVFASFSQCSDTVPCGSLDHPVSCFTVCREEEQNKNRNRGVGAEARRC